MMEEIFRPIDLSDLIEAEHIKTVKRLKESIEEYQDKLVTQILTLDPKYKRSSRYDRHLVTSLGEVILKIAKIDLGNQKMISPMLDVLQIRRKKYSQELRMLAADTASRLSYGKSKEQLMGSNSIEIPKATIHSFVQEVGVKLGKAAVAPSKIPEQPKTRESMLSVVEADGTKTHSTDHKENNVRVAMTYDQNTKEKHILGLVVNKGGWSDVAIRASSSSSSILVSDAEEGIQDNLKHRDSQLDLVHAVKDTLFRMWMDGATKIEREEVSVKMNEALYTLVNSVKKHLKDGNARRLSKRIESTISFLKEDLFVQLKEKGYVKAAVFVKSHARFMVTFAKIALTTGKVIPYTSNAVERLMGEISYRCKHKWMSWSTNGLENLLWILLIRYTDKRFYQRFWNGYIHPSFNLGEKKLTTRALTCG
jgi:hypothetical protein